jgi:hypothetical protein
MPTGMDIKPYPLSHRAEHRMLSQFRPGISQKYPVGLCLVQYGWQISPCIRSFLVITGDLTKKGFSPIAGVSGRIVP